MYAGDFKRLMLCEEWILRHVHEFDMLQRRVAVLDDRLSALEKSIRMLKGVQFVPTKVTWQKGWTPGKSTLSFRQMRMDDAFVTRQLNVLWMRNEEHRTFKEIGKAIGVTLERARQIYAKATRLQKRGQL